jgi:hypothetical protein
MRNIQEKRFLVHSQISRHSPHSVILCMIVSRSPHVEQTAEIVSRIVCSRSFVGKISWITLTQLALTNWHTQPAVRRAEPSMPLLLILALYQ